MGADVKHKVFWAHGCTRRLPPDAGTPDACRWTRLRRRRVATESVNDDDVRQRQGQVGKPGLLQEGLHVLR